MNFRLRTIPWLPVLIASNNLDLMDAHLLYWGEFFDKAKRDASGPSPTSRALAREKHDELLSFLLNRWLDLAAGRWISEDPIGFAGGDANLTRYVGNGVISFTDPS